MANCGSADPGLYRPHVWTVGTLPVGACPERAFVGSWHIYDVCRSVCSGRFQAL